MTTPRLPAIPPSISYGLLTFAAAILALQQLPSPLQPPPLWPLAGIGLAGVLLHGPLLLPAITLSAAAALWLHGFPPLAILAGAGGLLVEILFAGLLLRHIAPSHRLLGQVRPLIYLLLIGVLIAPLTGAVGAAAMQLLTTGATAQTIAGPLVGWWIADATGVILITPLLLAWRNHPSRGPRRRGELILLLLALLAVCSLVFAGRPPLPLHDYPAAYLPLPLLAWSMLRFQHRTTTLATILVAGFALWGHRNGVGPFTGQNVQLSTLHLQIYLLTLSSALLLVKSIMTERERAIGQLSLASQIIAHSPDGIIVTNTHGIIQSANPAFYDATGFKPQETIGRSIQQLSSIHHSNDLFKEIWRKLRRDGVWEGEVWSRNSDGEILPQWLSLTVITDDQRNPTHYLGVYSNIARQKQVQERIHRLAYYDVLTGLPNRQLFNDRLDQALKYARRHKSRLALFFLDLDRFKNINDSLGHSVGDGVLQQTAERLQGYVRQTDTLARLGGDEFTIIIQGVTEDFDAILVAEKVIDAFKLPILIGEHELFVTPSIGISMFPEDGDNSEELVKHADTAMYRAKELGGNGFQFFAADMSDPVHWNLTIENALRRAIEQHAIQVLYQPQFDLRSGALIGLEALARWHHRGPEETPPGVFIKVAEETGLIHPLGDLILEIASRQVVAWAAEGFDRLRVAVNVSPVQLKQSDFTSRLRRIVERCGATPAQIEIEVTETTLMESAGFMENLLNLLSAQGFSIAVDDFGTGYSSLSYLKRLSIDRLKIDRSFIRDIPDDANDAAICSAIISMAHSLRLRVIAEGVETKEQMDFLRRDRCDEIQGFLFSKPVGAEEVSEMIRQGYWHLETPPAEPPPPRKVSPSPPAALAGKQRSHSSK